MSNTDERDATKQGQVSGPRKLELKKTVETGQVRQSFSHGRSKMVTVEVRKKRTIAAETGGRDGDKGRSSGGRSGGASARDLGMAGLTNREKETRFRALHDAKKAEEERAQAAQLAAEQAAIEAEKAREAEEEARRAAEAREAEEAAARAAEAAAAVAAAAALEAARREEAASAASTPVGEPAQAEGSASADEATATSPVASTVPTAPARPTGEETRRPASGPGGGDRRRPQEAATAAGKRPAASAAPTPANTKLQLTPTQEEEGDSRGRSRRGPVRTEVKKAPVAGRRGDVSRRAGAKITVLVDTEEGAAERVRSLASVRRAREKERQKQLALMRAEAPKVVRDVIVPEVITVQELANRMAERGADVIKALMRMGVMATITQSIDADTAELVVQEFGHNLRRVSDSDVEIGLRGDSDTVETLVPRPPVVTVMGHVDHGKTSLLDALRKTDVAAHEAGGITQHIGAYQVTLASGHKITFIDTPGHAAFTQMRARGAKATDVVVLVVAADDGVMPQTVEAITHAKAAGVPIIVAINKVDRPDANPQRVRTELLQHGIQVEEMGGETLSVEVSAKQGTNLDKLAEAILLQAEVLDMKANPDRPAEGVIIETKVERGRGAVATVLVQRGTLRIGDTFVAGSEWGRVRGLTDAAGAELLSAEPGMPAEILGLSGMPAAGDDLIVVPSEVRAREVTEFRQRRQRDARTTASRSTLEQMFSRIKDGEAKELALVLKADVHGSAEAIVGALDKLSTDDVKINVLHAGVGGINESDVTLARASNALVIGFNVRANPQARELARRDRVEIRYYSIIYELADDIKQMLSGMLTPIMREHILGYADIREVFSITKVGKVAGCMVTEGIVKRGCRLRLLRDSVVIHDGEIGQLKRFKDDVREVKEGYDCGISLANFQDIQVGDILECYEMEEVVRHL